MNLEILKSNLMNMYTAAHQSKNGNINLVADWSGHRIYSGDAGWGLVLSLFYRIIDHSIFSNFRNGSLKERKLKAALIHTDVFFHREKRIAKIALEKYNKGLKYLYSKGLGLDDQKKVSRKFKASRDRLIQWSSATSTWIKFTKSGKSKAIKQLFKKLTSNENLIRQKYDYKSLLEIDSIAVECFLLKSLPVGELYNLASGIRLDENGNQKVREFNKTINGVQGLRLSHLDFIFNRMIQQFELARKGAPIFHEIRKRRPHLDTFKSAYIEIFLNSHDKILFFSRDRDFIKKRNREKSGNRISIEKNGVSKLFTLGKEIGKKIDRKNDNHIVFEVKEDPSILVVFGYNRSILQLCQRENKNYRWAVKNLKYDYFDRDRGFAVIQKAPYILNKINWKSESDLCAEDKRFAEPIAELLRWFIAQNASPLTISPEYLVFTKDNELRSLRPLIEDQLNYDTLFEFAYKCSNGNKAVLNYFIQTLLAPNFTLLFIDAMKEKLGVPTKKIQLDKNFRGTVVEYFLKKFKRKITQLQNECLAVLNDEFEVSHIKKRKLQKEICSAIKKVYIRILSIGYLPDGMKEKVIFEVIRVNDLEKKQIIIEIF